MNKMTLDCRLEGRFSVSQHDEEMRNWLVDQPEGIITPEEFDLAEDSLR